MTTKGAEMARLPSIIWIEGGQVQEMTLPGRLEGFFTPIPSICAFVVAVEGGGLKWFLFNINAIVRAEFQAVTAAATPKANFWVDEEKKDEIPPSPDAEG